MHIARIITLQMSSAIGVLLSVPKCLSTYDTRLTIGVYPRTVEDYLCRIANIYMTKWVDLEHNAGDKADLLQRK